MKRRYGAIFNPYRVYDDHTPSTSRPVNEVAACADSDFVEEAGCSRNIVNGIIEEQSTEEDVLVVNLKLNDMINEVR